MGKDLLEHQNNQPQKQVNKIRIIFFDEAEGWIETDHETVIIDD